MQRLVGIFLLICFTMPVAGSYLWLRYERKLIKREVKTSLLKGVDKKHLVLLSFTLAEEKTLLEWEHEREFSFKGQKYDVVSREKVGENSRYWCWKDVKESTIDRKIAELTQQVWEEDDEENKRHKTAIETVKSIPEFASPDWCFEPQFPQNDQAFFRYSRKLRPIIVASTAPPPEVFC